MLFVMADWFRWLENIRDWCISRQLWWGHQIPAWYVTLEDDELVHFGAYDDHWVVGRNEDEAHLQAKQKFPGKRYYISQDPDVLDTWFSSGLFPFSVMGWPEETVDVKTFYPTTLLETGHDILFFWVARMVMLGMKLTGQVPFKKIYLHAMVRDAHGRKMSKSFGNVIDPVDVVHGITLDGLLKKLVQSNLSKNEIAKASDGLRSDFLTGIEQCGTDALRFGLVAYTVQVSKPTLAGGSAQSLRATQETLWICLENGLRLLHPFMPFVTEELWQRLPCQSESSRKPSIMVAEYPSSCEEWEFPAEIESEMQLVQSIGDALRSLQTSSNLDQKLRPDALLLCRTDEMLTLVLRHSSEIVSLARLSSLKFTQDPDAVPKTDVAIVNPQISALI